MKQETLFLKVVVILMGVPVAALCVFGLPSIAKGATNTPAYLLYPFILGMYATAVPFFVALYQTFRLLTYIDGNKAFSSLSVQALKNIKYCAVAVSIFYSAGLPLMYRIADVDDAPGLLLLALVIPFASIVIAVFAAVLQKLLQNAIDLKSENDLTV